MNMSLNLAQIERANRGLLKNCPAVETNCGRLPPEAGHSVHALDRVMGELLVATVPHWT
jgi:hypothetical protein